MSSCSVVFNNVVSNCMCVGGGGGRDGAKVCSPRSANRFFIRLISNNGAGSGCSKPD